MSSFFERIDAVLAQQKMPPEYDDHVSEILCNDCERSSRAKYNFLYHKCAYCASYNTKVLRTLKPGDVDQDAEGGRTSEIPGSLSSVAAARPPSWTPTDGDTAADQVAALALDNPENLPTGNGELPPLTAGPRAHVRSRAPLAPGVMLRTRRAGQLRATGGPAGVARDAFTLVETTTSDSDFFFFFPFFFLLLLSRSKM
ncbi:MAG: zinc-ribbon-domain-containing protein [Olpidium bornovanus]|uniref:Zinc-ribbon-domain-containing protein n=1 Tax=Olpidium bornovanus TaxID=278681 RepID=A0A8H7ZZ34_9FUNG|nr:MAG: zinc-ribbon-domain-containing protein [Olpidium bornovanus]